MLIEKKVEVGDIVSLKLFSGEEIIGKLKVTTSSGLMISKPLVVGVVAIPAPDGTMQHALQLSPFMFGLDETSDVDFPYTSLITYVKTREGMKQSYIKETSGIEVPKGPTLVV